MSSIPAMQIVETNSFTATLDQLNASLLNKSVDS